MAIAADGVHGHDVPEEHRSFLQKLLDGVEKAGNKVPDPAVIFLGLMVLVALLSHVLYAMGVSVTYQAVNPETDQVEEITTAVQSLLTVDGIRHIFTTTIQNFSGFGPLAIILVVMVGVGLAEEAGLVAALIHKLIGVTPRSAVTFVLVCLGVLSSIASDAGYLVLIPVGAAVFHSVGRHPVAGIAAAFAGVASGFTVNLMITPTDAVWTEVTNEAIALLDPSYQIDLTANLYFAIVSSLLVAVVCTVITEKFIEPRLGPYREEADHVEDASEKGLVGAADESRGLRYSLFAFVGFIAVLALLTLPAGAPLRNPETGSIVGDSPFMQSLIVSIMLLFLLMGIAYGKGARTITNSKDGIKAIVKTFSNLAALIFLLLVISQFLGWFNYSNLATIAAVTLGDALENADVNVVLLLIGFIAVTVVMDLVMTGAIPKWAIFAPIFVPLFMRLGTAPETVLAAYRVGDSPFNAVTPLMAYFALIVVLVQRYKKEAGVGTVVSMMLPYAVALQVVWTVLFVIWYALGIPLGPGANIHMS